MSGFRLELRLSLRRRIFASVLVASFVVACAYALFPETRGILPKGWLDFDLVRPVVAQSLPAESQPSPRYETRVDHDPNGTGKFYMGREIAQVMGPGGIEWLDRREREEEEHPAQVFDALDLRPGEVVADLGAGSGYFTFRMAPKVGATGKILAVEVQEAMLQTLRERAALKKVANVEVIQGSETDPHLPAGGVDLVLLVDVYHELAYPFEVMTKVRESLKPKGRVAFVEYRKEDAAVRIKEVHKMSVRQLEKEMNAVGLVRVRTVETLPLQHIVLFEKQ
jgi:ubiquinone/menaquinone biosynthesis C-methylase UbiE